MIKARPLSISSANVLYLGSMTLVVGLGSFLQARSIAWGLLLTELALILLPALVVTKLQRLDATAVLRWRWPGWRVALLGLVIGFAAWPVSVLVDGVSAGLLGYTPPSPFVTMPADPLTLIAFFVALAVAAPVCEEVLFRGYLLSAYGRCRPAVAITAVSLLFAFYHLRLQGLPAVVLLGFVLTVLAWRSNSLMPSILAHVAINAPAAALVIVSLAAPQALSSGSPFVVALSAFQLISPVVLLAALFLFHRSTRRTQAEPVVPQTADKADSRLMRVAPLLGAAILYVVFAGLELVSGRFPGVLAESSLQLQTAPWQQPAHLTYDIRNVQDETAGHAACAITPGAEVVDFDCGVEQEAFEVKLANSYYASGAYTAHARGQWQAGSMRVSAIEYRFTNADGESSASVWRDGDDKTNSLLVSIDGGPDEPLAVPDDALFDLEGMWRLSALPFDRTGYFGSRVTFVTPSRWSEEHQRMQPQAEPRVVSVKGQERITVPAGTFIAWRVALDKGVYWYDARAPHHLLRFDSGYGTTLVLTSGARPADANE